MSNDTPPSTGGKLGTFGGVFTPSLLTILGLVLFLRLGFVVGNVGLFQMLFMLALATSVSVVTTISLAAIATNLRVGGGGVYFIISRTLGPAFGGAIGLVLYVAMAVSVAFYSIGLGEAVASALGIDSSVAPRFIAAITIVALTGLAWFGADIATKLQYVVLVCLAVAIVAYFIGVVPDLDFSNVGDNLGAPSSGNGFWISFAIFFPAITGFTQGVAMSGDLRTPSRSITVGTFAAIGVSTLVYAAVVITFALAVPLADLRNDTSIMRSLALDPILVDVGVVAATLSSAIASMLGAPRTLQRLAADRLVPILQPFEKGAGADNNPRRGVLLTAAIGLFTVATANLDVVAPIISMFFLASYGMINYATYSEARAASTSFRPTFKFFHWRLSLIGTLGCIGVILAIDPFAGALAGVAVFSLYRYLLRSSEQSRWADSTRGFHAAQVRTHLKAMGPNHEPGRDWRPCTLAFASRDPLRRQRLTAVASWIEGGAGLSTLVRIVPGRGPLTRKQASRIDIELQHELSTDGRSVFGRVIMAETLEDGVAAVLQAHGVGELRANVALYSWYADNEDVNTNHGDYEKMVQTGLRFGANVGVLRDSPTAWSRVPTTPGNNDTILVWWTDDTTGQLLTLMAWMTTRDSVWTNAKIKIWVVGNDPADALRVQGLLEAARLPATVAGMAESDEFLRVVEGAQFVLAPLRVRTSSLLGPDNTPIESLGSDLPVTLFVQAAGAIELDVQPDDSTASTLAVARDRAEELTKHARSLDERASHLVVAAEMARMGVDISAAGQGSGEAPPTIDEAAAAAAKAQRDYLDARSRADEAWRIVAEIDPTMSTEIVDPALWVSSARADVSGFNQT